MARKADKPQPPPSLVHLFESPEGMHGEFGWVCGYSADSAFLDLAVERFSHLTAGRRAATGRIWLALMADPTTPQISPVEVSGVLHIPLRTNKDRPFKLMHAKVALLGFRGDQDPQKWLLRLIVSTGNWTRQTLEESLDLAWQLDLDRSELKQSTDSRRQACADIREAGSLIDYLQTLFDVRALECPLAEHRESATSLAMKAVESWVKEAGDSKGEASPRFFHTCEASLLQQLPAQVDKVAGTSRRNCLVMGSGFFEASTDSNAVPAVLQEIVDSLRGQSANESLLTAKPDVTVFVNPKACQAVAAAFPALKKCEWDVREPKQPDFMGASRRTLHAKFLFSANWRSNSNSCTSAWLYLGSGNLTRPGFTKSTKKGGNLEAGVVIEVLGQTWSTICDVLPVQWDYKLDGSPGSINAGDPWEDVEPTFFNIPVPYLFRTQREGRICLQFIGDTERPNFDVLDMAGKPCAWSMEFGFSWQDPMPRQVRIRWSDDGEPLEAAIPVIDEYGRVAGAVLGKLDVDGAWAHLMNFPLPPPEEELDDTQGGAEVDADHGDVKSLGIVPTATSASYPIRSVMGLVESIAALQERLPSSDWTTWCMRMEQTLSLASECTVAEECRKLSINVLSPLRHREFRPSYAADNTSEEGRLYESALTNIEKAWRVDRLNPMGELL